MAVLVVDASVVIAVLDPDDGHHDAAVQTLRKTAAEEVILPASAYSEVLVGSHRDGPAAVEWTEALIAGFPFIVEPISAEIARAAAALRARHASLRLPDALVLATAQVRRGTVLTADRSWSRVGKHVETL